MWELSFSWPLKYVSQRVVLCGGCEQVVVVTQPQANAASSGPALVGKVLAVQPALRVTDSAGQGVAGSSVFAYFVNDDCSPAPAMLDISR
jgi:hypothetical protein